MIWIIKNGDNILGVFSSMEEAVSQVEIFGDLSEISNEELAILQRAWRNQELKDTDWIVPITDHPGRDSYLTYRTNLRNWPTTDNFPDTKPTL